MMYEAGFMAPSPADEAFTRLRDELAWTQRDNAPRLEYYVNRYPVPYTYGKPPYARTYQPQPSHPVIDTISLVLSAKLETAFDVCFLNRYVNQSKQLGWHADDSSEMDDLRPIAIVSLGAARDIMFRCRHDTPEGFANELLPNPARLNLGHGSLCVMPPGFQDRYEHRIPKSSVQCSDRISLVFRGYVVQP